MTERTETWVTSVAALYGHALGERVEFGGRIVHVAEGRTVLADATGTIPVETNAEPLAAGTWTIATGRWTGNAIVDGDLHASTEPVAEFPQPAGEWAWFHSDGRKRAGLIRQRAMVLQSIRRFFDEHDYVEVETPLWVRSPGVEVHLDAFEIQNPSGFLITSPELHMKRLLAAGFARIYQIARCFRRDEVGDHHEPEFTMLEWYRTFVGADETMRETETMVAAVASALRGTTQVGAIDFAPPWERLTVADAFARYANADAFALVADTDRFFLTLATVVQPQLGTTRPTFLVDWPAELASLARLKPENPRVAERYEAYVNGIELCNGFGELVDPSEQRKRCEADVATRHHLGRPPYPIDDRFLAALDEGLPEASGNALGIDRLLLLLSEEPRLSDVVAFGKNRR